MSSVISFPLDFPRNLLLDIRDGLAFIQEHRVNPNTASTSGSLLRNFKAMALKKSTSEESQRYFDGWYITPGCRTKYRTPNAVYSTSRIDEFTFFISPFTYKYIGDYMFSRSKDGKAWSTIDGFVTAIKNKFREEPFNRTADQYDITNHRVGNPAFAKYVKDMAVSIRNVVR